MRAKMEREQAEMKQGHPESCSIIEFKQGTKDPIDIIGNSVSDLKNTVE